MIRVDILRDVCPIDILLCLKSFLFISLSHYRKSLYPYYKGKSQKIQQKRSLHSRLLFISI